MSILNIRKAERAGARLVIGIDAISGDGKTYSALQLAWGLADYDASKIGFLDTENRRGSLYADVLKDQSGKVHEFYIADLDAPFTPERYASAIKEWQAAGIKVLVIDSVTHEYEGEGGVQEIAEIDPRTKEKRKLPAWQTAKARHKVFMNALLQSDMHIICCIRSREKVRVEKDNNGKTVFIPEGILPIQEKNFVFELTASMQLAANGTARFVKKCPSDLIEVFGVPGEWSTGYLTADHGYKLLKWVEGAKPVDDVLEKARNYLRTEASTGVKTLQTAWDKMKPETRDKFNNEIPNDILASAQAYDEMNMNEADQLNEALN